MAKKKLSFECPGCGKEYFEKDCGVGFQKDLNLTIICECDIVFEVFFKQSLIFKKLYINVVPRKI